MPHSPSWSRTSPRRWWRPNSSSSRPRRPANTACDCTFATRPSSAATKRTIVVLRWQRMTCLASSERRGLCFQVEWFTLRRSGLVGTRIFPQERRPPRKWSQSAPGKLMILLDTCFESESLPSQFGRYSFRHAPMCMGFSDFHDLNRIGLRPTQAVPVVLLLTYAVQADVPHVVGHTWRQGGEGRVTVASMLCISHVGRPRSRYGVRM
mmetsp:Transcript_75890/g.201622  ORF Transcript_75890/g.201622 Transcript_75890/m.201622 type:complete len:208 (+) Transcript_75890:63-686(+)